MCKENSCFGMESIQKKQTIKGIKRKNPTLGSGAET